MAATDEGLLPKSFFFANADPGSPLSYEALQTRRKIAEQLLGRRSPFPKTLGEGLTYAGEKIYDVMTMNALERQDAAYQNQRRAAAAQQMDAGEGRVPVAPPVRSVAPRAYAPVSSAPADPRDAVTAAIVPPPDASATTSFDDRFNAAKDDPRFTDASEPVPPQDAVSPATLAAATTGVPLPPRRPAIDRGRQLAELQANPGLQRRLAATTLGEVDPGASTEEQKIQYATALNRAQARDIPMAQALETYTGRGSRGYYPPEVVPRGERILQDPMRAEAFKRDVEDPVLRGEDPGRGRWGFSPTGNASGGVASRGVASGRYGNAGRLPGRGETFVTQETPGQTARLDEGRARAFAGGLPSQPQDAMGAILAATQGAGAPQPIPFSQATPMGPQEPSQRLAQAPLNPAIPRPDISTLPRPQQPQQNGTTQFPPLPPVAQVENLQKPKQPDPVPVTDAEKFATFRRDQTADPVMRQGWESIIAREQAKRKFLDDRNVKNYDVDLTNYTANQVYAREARQKAIEAAAAEQKLRESTPQGAPKPAAGYDPTLGTPASKQRVGAPELPAVPEGVEPHKWRELQAPIIAKAGEAYERALPAFNRSIQLIQETRNHAGYDRGVGAAGKFNRSIWGTEAYGFGTRVEQLKGKNFLAGYEVLKGSGPVSNIEGTKTEQAQARLDPNQSKSDFDHGLADLEISMREDLEQLQRKMRVPVTAWRKPGDNSSVAPDKGERRGNMEYIGGNPALKESWRAVQ